jgi:hypothetical protein
LDDSLRAWLYVIRSRSIPVLYVISFHWNILCKGGI